MAEEDHVDETGKVENGNDEEQKAEDFSEEFHGVIYLLYVYLFLLSLKKY